MATSRNGKPIGVFDGDDFPGEFCESWKRAMQTFNFDTIDIEASVGYFMAIKDKYELAAIKEASLVSLDIFNNYLKKHIAEIVDAKKVSSIF